MHIIDLTVIAIYIFLSIVIGIACRGRQQKADDYFTARGEMTTVFKSIVVGLSLAATLFSGISFIAYPSIAYGNGLSILLGLLSFPLAFVILKFWFLPRFLTSETKNPYDIIEHRLGPETRTVAAVMYVLLRIGWMAALIYAPTIAMLAAGRLDDTWFWPLVLATGLSCTFYTTLGGIRGVIVTDAIQFVILTVGIIVTVIFIIVKIPVSFSEVIATIRSLNAAKLDFSLDPSRTFTVWAIIIGFSINNLANYMADQMSLQRYLATGDQKATVRSFLFNIIGATGVLVLLAIVGMLLAVWYKLVPDAHRPEMTDKIFPYFVATNLPVGVLGLLLAAILAATMSSMCSGINTLASTITYDFRMRLGPIMSQAQELRFGRICSIVIGLASTFIAGAVGKLGTIFDMAQTLLGLFLGPLFACMILAMTSFAVNGKVVATGIVLGLLSGGIVVWLSWSSLWVAPVSFCTTFIIAILGSIALGSDRQVKAQVTVDATKIKITQSAYDK